MNYFEIYNITPSLKIDKAALKKTFYSLNMQYHPDRWVMASSIEQQIAADKIETINKAYTILTDENKLLQYTFLQLGIIQAEEEYKLSNMFLMEMLELNEAIMEAKMEDDKNEIEKTKLKIISAAAEVKEPIAKILDTDNLLNLKDDDKLALKKYYYENKYIQRLLEQLN
jgi:molecular chaperone HscB